MTGKVFDLDGTLAPPVLTYKPDIFSALEIYRTDKQFASADDWEEQSGNGGDQQVLQHQHGSAVPTS